MLLACCAAFALAALAPSAEAAPRRAHIIVDAETGRELTSKRADKVMHPASLTKMMTLYLVFDAIAKGELDLNDTIKFSRAAARMPASKLGLRRGGKITIRDAVRAAAVFSANDAAVALAEAVAGSERAFARRMTSKALQLGMTQTTFRNASGLTARKHRSTPRDMAILARRLWKDFPDNYVVFGRKKVRVKGRTRYSTNRVMRARKDVDGIKTGYTAAAGFNLAAAAERNGARVIVVAMGERSRKQRDKRVSALLDVGFEKLSRLDRAIEKAPKPKQRPAGGEVTPPSSGLIAAVSVALETITSVGDDPDAPDELNPPEKADASKQPDKSDKPDLAPKLAPSPTPYRVASLGQITVASIKPGVGPAPTFGPRLQPSPRVRQLPTRARLVDAVRAFVLGSSESSTESPPADATATEAALSSSDGDAGLGNSVGWQVQVGAYPTFMQARERMISVTRRYAPALTSAKGSVEQAPGPRRLYRARFGGLDERRARDACDWLKPRGVSCALVPPQGWADAG
ncbi:MAG: D-alanyl-D-alanine carboxypeptidase [Rhodobacteraceae bacterium]|nr:D-alanyl-D-alanine carboxypeptidase [Paracoccaceae bacterium]